MIKLHDNGINGILADEVKYAAAAAAAAVVVVDVVVVVGSR